MSLYLLFVLLTAEGEGANSDQNSLEQIGERTFFPFSPFEGIPNESKPFLRSIWLERLEFDPEFLFESLEGCEKLETLTLVKVDLKGEFKRKVYLPSLRRFSLSRFNWDVKATSPEELMASISFYTDAAALQTWNTSSVYTSGAEVTLEDDFNFRLFFNGIMLDVENFPGGDLTKYFHPYSQLSLYSTVWNVSNTLGLNLTYVYLRNVDLINWNQPQFPHLTSLTLKVTSEPKLTLDLSLLPTQTLKELVLENINLISTSTFEALEKLTLSRLCFSNTTQALFASRNLKDLRLWDLECDSGEIEVSTFLKSCGGLERLTLQALRSFDPADLESSRESLKDLHLDGVGVVSQSEVFQFRQLDELLLRGKVSFSSPQLFSTTFKLTEVMEFHGFTFEPGFLKEVLKTRVNKIKIHSGREIQLGAEVETFLAQAGVPAHLYFRDVSYSLQKRNQTWEYNEDDDTPDVSMARDRDVIMYAYTLSLLSISSLGILGNVLSGGVLSRKRMRSSTSFTLLGLTLSDLTLLITYLPAIVYYGLKLIMIFLKYRATEEFGFAYWFLRTKIKQLDVGRFEQQQAVFFYPLNKTAYTGSVYATVLLTLERYVAVCWPLKARLWLRPQRAALITLAVLLFAVLLNLPRWFEGYGSLKTVGQHSFDGKQGAIWKFNRTSDASNVLLQESYRKYYHGWVWLTLMYALPIPLLTFLNYKIWTEVKRSNSVRVSSSPAASDLESSSITRMIFAVTSVFVVCNCVNGSAVWALLWFGEMDPSHIEVLACIPLILNSSVNFIIYCFLGTKFRTELATILPRACVSRCRGLPARWGLIWNRYKDKGQTTITQSTRRAKWSK